MTGAGSVRRLRPDEYVISADEKSQPQAAARHRRRDTGTSRTAKAASTARTPSKLGQRRARPGRPTPLGAGPRPRTSPQAVGGGGSQYCRMATGSSRRAGEQHVDPGVPQVRQGNLVSGRPTTRWGGVPQARQVGVVAVMVVHDEIEVAEADRAELRSIERDGWSSAPVASVGRSTGTELSIAPAHMMVTPVAVRVGGCYTGFGPPA